MPGHSTPVSGPKTVYQEVLPPPELVELTKAGVEVWCPVVGADGWYDVSNLGRVRTWVKNPGKARVRTERRAEPKLLTPQKQPQWGYWVVTLRINGRQITPLVHCLMAEAFIGPRPGNFRLWQAAHGDDNSDRNTLDNIRWATAVANMDDRTKNGRAKAVERPFEMRGGVKFYRCNGCHEWKAETEFGVLGRIGAYVSKCGRRPRCRPCSTADRKKYPKRRAG